jgi:hypothetical protein
MPGFFIFTLQSRQLGATKLQGLRLRDERTPPGRQKVLNNPTSAAARLAGT